MRGGEAVRVSLSSPKFAGETLPLWISEIKSQPSVLDASAVVHTSETGKRSLAVAVVNRSEAQSFKVPIRVAFEDASLNGTIVDVHELWHGDVKAKNGWGSEDEVTVETSRAAWTGEWTFREHSFTLLVLHAK